MIASLSKWSKNSKGEGMTSIGVDIIEIEKDFPRDIMHDEDLKNMNTKIKNMIREGGINS